MHTWVKSQIPLAAAALPILPQPPTHNLSHIISHIPVCRLRWKDGINGYDCPVDPTVLDVTGTNAVIA